MKLVIAILLCSSTSFAAKYNVTGLRAKAVIDAAIALDLGTSFGTSEAFVELEKITTEKIGDENGTYIGERLRIGTDVLGELVDVRYEVLETEAQTNQSRRQQRDRLEFFRQALSELVQPTTVRSTTVIKRIEIERLRCHADGLDQAHESVDAEPTYRCDFSLAD